MPNFRLKKWITWGIVVAILVTAVTYYLYSKEYADTAMTKADFTLDATALLNEFQQQDTVANKKYTEKIIEVSGTVGAVEKVDTTVNIKMIDSNTGSYLIFALQASEQEAAKMVKAGDKVSIKGSCSGAVYSEILETWAVSFKRAVLVKE